jgi:hypothetical protein
MVEYMHTASAVKHYRVRCVVLWNLAGRRSKLPSPRLMFHYLYAETNLSIQIIECPQQTDHMRQSSEDNHDMENLMAAAIYIVS